MNISTSHFRSILLFFFFSFSVSLVAQNPSKIWQELHANNRAKALEMVNKKGFVKDVETSLLRQIVRMENGLMLREDNFLKELSTYPNYENYLFAHWFFPYALGDYLDSGFNSYNVSSIKELDQKTMKNNTVRDGYVYYKSVVERYQNNWDTYLALNKKIESVTQWEYCGPFENLNNSGLDTQYPPETTAVTETPFNTRRNGSVNWYAAKNSGEPYQFFLNHSELISGINYAQTFVDSAVDQRVNLKVGKGGIFQLFVNDVLVFENDKDRLTEMDAYTIAVNLKKGNNRLLVKTASYATYPYFMIKIVDDAGNPIKNVSVNLTNKEYSKSTLAEIAPKEIPNPFYTFFENRLADKKGDKDLNRFSLVMAYMRNSEFEKAQKMVESWLEEYPNSTFIKSILAEIHNSAGDSESYNEIIKNIETFDPNYYLSLMNKFQNFDELYKMDIETYESTLQKLSQVVDYSFIATATDLLLELRRQRMNEVEAALDKFIEDPSVPSSLYSTFVMFYSQLFNNDEKTIKKLEENKAQHFNYDVDLSLAYYYEKQNRKDEALEILNESVKKIDYDNAIIQEYIAYLHDYQRYEESLPYIEMGIENYPDTFVFLKLKAEALRQLDKTEEALVFYEKAIERNSSDSELRKLIYDLKKVKDPLDNFRLKEFYSFIEANRGKIKTNNYGVNFLLDQVDVQKYPSGGGRYKGTYIYEVTSQKGIDRLKEYNLGLYGDYAIYKSEIVKKDKSISPAEKSGSNFVFNGLEIGDVVLIDFEGSFSRSGRFYKDYVDTRGFNSYYPVTEKTFRLFMQEDNLKFKVTNGEIPYKKSKEGDFYVHEWSVKNDKELPMSEDFMPTYSDIARELHLSSIESWDEISNWYSDLVREQMEFDQTVEDAFKKIFPNGVANLSDDEKAKKIYEYVTGNFSYSYVSFKQSGFVPQKPEKTIKTKLGDCKDFSTLFAVLGKEAGLDVNLVLVLTSDYGKNALILPSTDFNHCIVKVTIDGKPQFLELTDKYLPYKALPVSLRNATGLEIPYNKGAIQGNELFKIYNVNRKKSTFLNDYIVDIADESSNIHLTTSVTGHLSSYYIELLSDDNENVKKEKISDDLLNRTKVDVELVSVDKVDKKVGDDKVAFETTITLNEKLNKIGSMKTFQLPYFSIPYNQSVVSLNERKYPINYLEYENTDVYEDSMLINIEEGHTFVEIPESKEFSFKGHSYTITYEKTKETQLKVTVKAVMSYENIEPDQYPEFRKYVKDVLETRKQFIAFK